MNESNQEQQIFVASASTSDGAPSPPIRNLKMGFFGRLGFVLKMVEVRLRFLVVLVGIGAIVAYWDSLTGYWDKMTRPPSGAVGSLDNASEYFCPMDPSVIRASLEGDGSIPKCPICGMVLSKRTRGESTPLPDGIISRVSLSPDRVRLAGVQTSEAKLLPLSHNMTAVGYVAYDETRLSRVVARVGGYLEKLHVNQTFQLVAADAPLAEIYSPELSATVQEMRLSKRGNRPELATMGRERLRLLGLAEQEIDEALNADETKYRLTLRSPRAGLVVSRKVLEGDSVVAGQSLLEIADNSVVWIEADIFEKELPMVRPDQPVTVELNAFPGETFSGSVQLIYPEINLATRTARVRFAISNEDRRLLPGMFAKVSLATPLSETPTFQRLLASYRNFDLPAKERIELQRICPVTGAPLGSMGDPVLVTVRNTPVYLCCDGCVKAIENTPDKYLAMIEPVTENEVLSIPETAVVDTGNQKIIYIDRGEGTFEGVSVELGPRSAGRYSVLSGLLPGDLVVSSGAFLIDAETRLNPSVASSYFGATGSPNATGAIGNSSVTSTTQDSGNPMLPAVLPNHRGQNSAAKSSRPPEPKLSPEEQADFDALPAEDIELAKAQKWCPITDMALGTMGVPLKLDLEGRTVFICCKGCEKRLRKEATEMLRKLDDWKSP